MAKEAEANATGTKPATSDNASKRGFDFRFAWLFLVGSLIILLAGWIISVIFNNSSHSNKAIDSDKKIKQVTVEINFNPTLYHGRYEPHGNLQTFVDKEKLAAEVKNLEGPIKTMIENAFEDAFKAKAEALGSRVDDTWSAVQGIGLISAIIGVLITVLVLYFSFSNADTIDRFAKNAERDIAELRKHTKDDATKQVSEAITIQQPAMADEVLSNVTQLIFKPEYIQKILDEKSKSRNTNKDSNDNIRQGQEDNALRNVVPQNLLPEGSAN